MSAVRTGIAERQNGAMRMTLMKSIHNWVVRQGPRGLLDSGVQGKSKDQLTWPASPAETLSSSCSNIAGFFSDQKTEARTAVCVS